MTSYRWNTDAATQGYDAAAEHIHPYYIELQDQILKQLDALPHEQLFIVDAGGGSGRLMEQILDRFPNADGLTLDQSEPNLTLAAKRLQRFNDRARLAQCRLQDAWDETLIRPADAIVSMSAIHHLDPGEKQELYSRFYHYLAPVGIVLNGDEIRPESDEDYLFQLERWSSHMEAEATTGNIPLEFEPVLDKWRRATSKSSAHQDRVATTATKRLTRNSRTFRTQVSAAQAPPGDATCGR